MAHPSSVSLNLLYERMDRLEELIEDLNDLGITSRSEAEKQIEDLDRQIEELEAQSEGQS